MSKIPQPTGYRILIKPYKQPNKTPGGIYLTDQTQDTNRLGMVRAEVIALGPLAYKDPNRFGVIREEDGLRYTDLVPWCREGDWVLIGKYNGTRFKVDDEEYRLVEDDTILATLPDPSAIKEV